MDSRRFEIGEDLQEIRRLANESASSSIKDLLMSHCIKLEEELKSLPVSESTEAPHSFADKHTWKNIEKFAWDQDDSVVRVYVTSLDGFKSHPKEKYKVGYTENSAVVSIVDFKGTNYRLKFPRLQEKIQSARVTAKSNGFTLTLKKEGYEIWESVEYRPPIVQKVDHKKPASANPADDLVDIMKEMYENGDEEIRKTIAQAWIKAREEKK